MLQIYKKPQRHTIYWAVEDVKRAERTLGGPVANRPVTREANCVADDMARRALTAKGNVTYMQGEVPADAPPNQVDEVYVQQGAQLQLDWSTLPTPVDWAQWLQPSAASVASVFGQ